jgi:hypothetical protein
MTKRILVLVALSALASACSIKADVGSGSPAPGFDKAFKNKITGPAVEGTWKSGCVYNYGQYHQRTATFKGQAIVRTDNSYSDSNCQTRIDQSEYTGKFRWLKKTSYGGYVVDYHFDVGGGVTWIVSEELLIEDSALYLSNFVLDAPSMDTSFPMYLDGSSATPPTPPQDPSEIVGIPATSWANVKYAYCNVQGEAMLLDFQGKNLSTVSSGGVKFQARWCNSSDAYQDIGSTTFGLNRTSPYMMSIADGYNGSIQENGQKFTQAFAVLIGNSGVCTYLQNKGTKGVLSDCK